MLELKITCDSVDDARIVLNAQQYHNLLSDLYQELRNARKHGDDASIVKVVDNFYSDIFAAIEHHTGPY